jgi:phage-related protein
VQEEYIADFRKKLNEAVEQGTVLDNWMIERQIDNLKSSAIAKLRELAVEARKEVNSALKEVYRTAVKEKAATMGNVENVSESKEGNTYRIRIEITD